MTLKPVGHRPGRHRLPAIHGRHHRRFRRAPRCCTGTWWPMCCNPKLWMRAGAAPRARRSTRSSRSTALPLYHIFALTVCCLLGMQQAALSILIPNPRDIPGFVKELAEVPSSTCFPAVNTLYNALLNNPDIGKLDFSRLRVANGGGMAVQEAVRQALAGAKTGCPVIEGYGLSETSPSATCQPTDDGRSSRAPSGCRCLPPRSSIRDDDGNELPLGQLGEICMRGPQVMAGYWNRPDETAKVMTPDGFFKIRRHRLHGRARLHQDRRPQEGHDPGVGLQRVSERGGGRGRASARACWKWRLSACRTSIRARRRSCSW